MLHQRKRSDASLSDEYETPDYIIAELSRQHGIFPKVDVCAAKINKCANGLDNSLELNWFDPISNHYDFWCNPPHSKTKEFVLKADEQWQKFNLNIMMIIPANAVTTKYFETVLDNVEYYPISGRITFLVNGEPSPYPARNGYFVVIWRKK